MTDINKKLLKLIIEGKTTTEIMTTLKISHKQLLIRLNSIKNSGYNLSYSVSDDGKVKYDILKSIVASLTNTLTINLEKDPSTFTALIVADYHTGHERQNYDRISKLYEYATKEDINIIINCGDIIHGCCNNEEEKTVQKQIEYLIKNHPYDKDILNLVCFGNHDYSALEKYGIDISKVLCYERPDFISLGFGTSLINIKNGQIIVSHPVSHANLKRNYKWPREILERKIILKGHGHHDFIKTSDKKCIIKVPTLSDIIYSQYATVPGALKLTIELNEDLQFDIVNVEHLIFMDNIVTTSFTKHELTGKQKLLTEDKILTRKQRRTI